MLKTVGCEWYGFRSHPVNRDDYALKRRTITSQSDISVFVSMFVDGDVEGAKSVLARNPELAHHEDYPAHPLLTEFVNRNNGHCYKQSHLRIADLLIPDNIRSFRDVILRDELRNVQQLLNSDNNLVHAQFTAGRGIAQAIHHWKSIAVAELLLNAGADIEALTTLGESPLSLQLRFGSVDGVRFLLEQGANPNNGSRGHMPTDSMVELITLLLDHGWDINNGQMHHDAKHGHGSRVQVWLQFGADPNSCNENGQTALHLIAATGRGRDAIQALATAGADIDARDNDGRTPLDWARDASRQTAADELMALGAQINA